MLKCKCGETLEPEWKYCPKCGEKIYKDEEEHKEYYKSYISFDHNVLLISNMIGIVLVTYCVFERFAISTIATAIAIIECIVFFIMTAVKRNKIKEFDNKMYFKNSIGYKIYKSVFGVMVFYEIVFVIIYILLSRNIL